MSKKKSLIVLVIILVFAIGIFFMYKRIKDKIGRFDFEDNKNIEMLNELNKNFKMSEDYTLEIFEVDGIAMEWVVKRMLILTRQYCRTHNHVGMDKSQLQKKKACICW